MFREVTRIKQRLSREEGIALLREQTRGVLALMGDDGYPYAVPINHWYDEQTGCLYFHSGMKGHKVDALAQCPKVSYCVTDQGRREAGDWALTYRSVIVFGEMRTVTDAAEAMDIVRRLSLQFTADTDYIEHEINTAGDHTLVLALHPAHITGKTVREA